ncbi:MAG: DUF1737 domain-containing protein [Verrucomicrobiae bacterium]
MTHTAHAPVATAHGDIDYIVVVSSEDDFHAGFHHFAEKVNRKLKAGYQLHGQPFSVHQTMCQAMVRPGDAPSSGDTTMFMKAAGYHS